jgi:hypothetical protein
LKDRGIDERIILKWIFGKWGGGHGLVCYGSGQGQVVGSCKCGNESSRSIKCGEFPDLLRSCRFLRIASAPCSK